MKDKIIMLVIGILIGAIITAGGFLIFGNNSSSDQGMQGGPGGDMSNFTPGEKPDGEMGDGNGPGGQQDSQSTDDSSESTNTTSTTSTESNT